MALEVALVLILIILILVLSREGFATQRLRAEAIDKWLERGGKGFESYMEYIDGTIVEYERVRELVKSIPDPNPDQIKKIL